MIATGSGEVVLDSNTRREAAWVNMKFGDRIEVKDVPALTHDLTAVSRTRATVLLITDPASSVGVRLTGSGDVGVAAGRGSGKELGVDFIAPETEAGKGEAVVTSGLQQSEFPASIPVGRITTAEKHTGEFQQLIRVKPAVDLRRLNFVKVLQWSPP